MATTIGSPPCEHTAHSGRDEIPGILVIWCSRKYVIFRWRWLLVQLKLSRDESMSMLELYKAVI